MTVLGIDYSTKAIDLVMLDDDSDAARHHRIDLRGRPADPLHAARRVRERFPRRSWFEEHGVWLAAIERPYGHPATLTALMRIQGAICAMLPPELELVEMHAAVWLAAIASDGLEHVPKIPRKSLERKHLARDAANRHGFYSPLLDATDAYGIAWAARHDADRHGRRQAA